LTALRVAIDTDFGAAIDLQRWAVALTRRMLSGAYRIPSIEWSIRGVFTHTAPMGAFRGAGRPEASYLVERLMDELARELGVDPAEIRMRNFVAEEDFPYPTGTGVTYDSGGYHDALRAVLDAGGYRQWRERQVAQKASDAGPLLGIGLASYVEMSSAGAEYAAVEVNDRGEASVVTGTSPHGQGHHTAWAQLAADGLGLPMERVTVVHGDTARVPRGGGTSGSRSAVLGGSAVATATEEVASLLRSLAAARL
jgi:carbon-monoxide dehydrogenase large subunit